MEELDELGFLFAVKCCRYVGGRDIGVFRVNMYWLRLVGRLKSGLHSRFLEAQRVTRISGLLVLF